MSESVNPMDDLNDWFRSATQALIDIRNDALRRVLNSEFDSARWHPNGFAVFRLGEETLGRIRLHVWPTTRRVLVDNHPRVHCHDWDLASLILAGSYSESLIELSHSVARQQRVYHFDYTAEGLDRFVETTDLVSIREGPQTESPPETFHYIPAGNFHITHVPSDTFAATLVMMSPPVRDVITTLIGPAGFGSPILRRQDLTRPQVDAVVRELGQALRP